MSDQVRIDGRPRSGDGHRTRLAVVTADPSGYRPDELAVCRLVESLSEVCRHTRLEVLLADAPLHRSQIDAWEEAGVDVAPGPPGAWPDQAQTWGTYSHVIVTASGLRAPVADWVERTQPQAARILYLPSVEFRQIDTWLAAAPPEQRTGMQLVRSEVENRLHSLASWADAVWCQEQGDAEFLTGWMPDLVVARIPPAVVRDTPPAAVAARRGVVIVCLDGHDILAGGEEAAMAALEGVIPNLRARIPGLTVTLVTDSPTPMLEAAARDAGATVRPAHQLHAVLAGARLALLAAESGTGQSEVMMACLGTGTPFVATPQAVDGRDLGPLGYNCVAGGRPAVATRAWQLLGDDAAWEASARDVDRLAAELYGLPARRAALAHALTTVGITPGRSVGRHRLDVMPASTSVRPIRRHYLAPTRPLDDRIGADDGLAPEPGPDRYRQWTERFGATRAVLDAIALDLATIVDPPRFSILMPVYNTDPGILSQAIDSIRGQIYPHWELCIANDGSDRPGTIEVLAGLADDARIRRVDLPGQGGISVATNAALALASGDYVAFVDHDDLLKPHALAQMARWIAADRTLDLVYSDEDIVGQDGELRDPHLKPDWSPDQLLSQNYICHLTVARRDLVVAVGGLRPEYDGSQDYDLVLRLTEMTDRIGHVPEPLYSWRATAGSFADDEAAKPYAIPAAQRAITEALARRGCDAEVEVVASSGRYRVRYAIPGNPKVAIIIPTKDRLDLLQRCIDSVVERSTYTHYEIVVVDNQSTEADTLAYLADGPWRVIRYPHEFNYARMVNLGARLVESDALLFLNNDTEVITGDWIQALLEHAMRPEVGIVGPRLYFGDGRVQHEGVVVGAFGDWANNIDHGGYFFRGEMVRNTSAVTGACCMVRPSVYWRVGGADEQLRVAYNDVDLCLRIAQAGYRVVYTPYAELYHHERSTRRGHQHHEDGPRFGRRWHAMSLPDPYYSPVFSEENPFEIRV